MPKLRTPSFLVLIAVCLGTTSALAQDEPSDAANVWQIVYTQWEAEEEGDRNWPNELLADNFSGWNKASPAPRDKASTIYWDRFSERQGKTVAHELYPLSIIVEGDVAIAHYLYTSAFQDKEGEIEVTNGRFTDVLVRTDNGWRFLSWHGGADGDD